MSALPSVEALIDATWRRGQLRYLLLPHQETLRAEVAAARARRYVWNCSRRLGKSFLLSVLAVEQCLQKPGSHVRYAAGTSEMVEEIIEPHMATILDDAPDDLAPDFNATKWRWSFPNGSSIRVAGCDDRRKANRLRGRACDLAIIDEAGFIDCLDYVIKDVLTPQLITVDGQMIISSTPPETPAHPFTGICADAEVRGAYSKRTIYDATHIDAATREEFRREANGAAWSAGQPDSTTWRREYLCEFVVDESRAIFPEFSDACVEHRERPSHFTPIIVGDAGFHDFTFIVGGYHDFRAAIDVVEWEFVTSKALARDIDAAVTAIATTTWGEAAAKRARRYIDAPAQIVAELGRDWSGIAKTETDGPFMGAAVNGVRQRMAGSKPTLRIDPACVQLGAHCRFGVWRTPGRDFERMEGFGHFDGCAALAYFDRLVDRRTNPFPVTMRDPEAFSWDPPAETTKVDRLRLMGSGARGKR